jgi:hypothetical protein
LIILLLLVAVAEEVRLEVKRVQVVVAQADCWHQRSSRNQQLLIRLQ